MPELRRDLEALVRIPSVSVPGQLDQPLLEAFELTTRLFADAGVAVGRLDLPDTAPVVIGEIPAPPGAPTVLLYSHYDVVPAGDEALWTLAAVRADRARRRDLRPRRGRHEVEHPHARRRAARVGRPAAGRDQALHRGLRGDRQRRADRATRATDPELFQADALIIGDMGSIPPGTPTLTTALRGMANVTLEVRTLESGKHSGQYGGAAPDALLALVRALASLHDEHGDVAVAGLRRNEWEGAQQPEERVPRARDGPRRPAAVRHRRAGLAHLVGPGDHRRSASTSRRSTAPSTPSRPYARAVLNVRVHPEQDAGEAQEAVIAHLRAQRPFGIELDVQPGPDRQRLRGGDRRPGVRGRAGGVGGGVGRGRAAGRQRRLDPDRQRAGAGRCPTPRRCSSAPPTATRTSTARTSACC